MEEVRILTIEEIKEELKEDLEYVHPNQNPMVSIIYRVADGFRPMVNNKLFESENDAVEYILQTDTLYKNIIGYKNHTKIIERYDEDDDLLFYSIYNELNKLTLKQDIFSREFNNYIKYTFEFEKDKLVLSNQNNKKAKCVYIGYNLFKWSDEENIEDIFLKNSIIYTKNTRNLFEYLWISWKSNIINNEEVEKELNSLVNWINAITKNKPSTDFWNKLL